VPRAEAESSERARRAEAESGGQRAARADGRGDATGRGRERRAQMAELIATGRG
jgi:hypothetical protein